MKTSGAIMKSFTGSGTARGSVVGAGTTIYGMVNNDIVHDN